MNSVVTLSEKSLIENCINYNRKSQRELYERFSVKMFAICLHFAQNQIDAEEILQNAFVKLFDTLHTFKGEESFEEWAKKIFVTTAEQHAKQNKVKITTNKFSKSTISEEYLTILDDLYENIYTKTSNKIGKDNSIFKLYAVDGHACREDVTQPRMSKSDTVTVNTAEKKSLIKAIQTTPSYKRLTNLKYTIQEGDERRISKDGILRVYNLKESIDIPVQKLLGKWKKEHAGVTLVLINGKWNVEGEMAEHTIQSYGEESTISLKRLLKFV